MDSSYLPSEGEENRLYMSKKEGKIKSFVLRVDADTMNAIEKWAADEFRSINGQLQWIISEALHKGGRLPRKRKTTEENQSKQSYE